jgi:succinate dehydrogenase / fumarate reductase, cytochrome b subunit
MSEWTDKRPMSPHVSVWRWHVTMLGSILHRMTGLAAYAGAFLVVGWLFAMTFGPERYEQFAALVASIPGQVVLFGLVLSIVYHSLNGVRHLVWDAGHGFRPQTANFTGYLVIILSIVAAVAIWIAAGLVPGIDPLGLTDMRADP